MFVNLSEEGLPNRVWTRPSPAFNACTQICLSDSYSEAFFIVLLKTYCSDANGSKRSVQPEKCAEEEMSSLS